MLSDKEKKAIKYLKQNNIVEIQYDNYGLESIHRVGIDEKQTILNLIEKQSKEIEELINEVMEKELIIDGMKEDRRIAVEEIQEQYFVSKEESEQRERKAYIKGTNDADELCNKKWKDKIKVKIEELDNTETDKKYTMLFNSDNVMNVVKAVLQELLEKE